MSTQRILKGVGRGCLQQFALRIGIGLAVLPFMMLCIVLPLVLTTNSNLDPDLQIGLFIASVFGFILLLLAVTFSVVGWVLVRRARRLDLAFTPLGLEGNLYMLNGRQYHGQSGGRGVSAYYYRGPTLDLYIKAKLGTRASIANKDGLGQAISGLVGYKPIPNTHPQLSNFNVYALDPAWMQTLLNQPAVREAIVRLMTPSNGFEIRSIILQPEQILLKLAQNDTKTITDKSTRQWFADLATLAQAATALLRPTVTATPNAFESADPKQRQKTVIITTVVLVSVLVGLGVCFNIAAIASGMLSGS